MLLTLKSALDTIKQIFSTLQSNTEHQAETTIIKDKKNLKKASNITEEILILTDKYLNLFEEKDQRKYNRLKKKFLRNN